MEKGNKRLVICCDGTWNEPDQSVDGNAADETEPTNVLKVVRGLAPVDGNQVPQVVFYDTGVGTQGAADKYIGGGLGSGLSANIRQAYRFIANNYHEGDELFLFGFSRGAYTVRSLAGFIGVAGLLQKENLRLLPEAYALYRLPSDKRPGSMVEQRLEAVGEPSRKPLPIRFIGVWDTVGALGAPTPLLGRLTRKRLSFHNTQLGREVKHAYQALAVDERRRPFQPVLWTGAPVEGQTIEQAWFAGAHSNIGGGYRNSGLSNIALFWLAGCAARHGLAFADAIARMTPPAADQGRVEDSFSMGYQALRIARVRPYEREIGPKQHGDIRGGVDVAPGECAHGSVVEAIGKHFAGNPGSKPYEPRNLLRALEEGLPVWKETV